MPDSDVSAKSELKYSIANQFQSISNEIMKYSSRLLIGAI